MEQTWRWFRPDDKVSLADIRQAGATGIVTALHHLPPGEHWGAVENASRQAQISEGSDEALYWRVVGSPPASEEIGLQTHGMAADLTAFARRCRSWSRPSSLADAHLKGLAERRGVTAVFPARAQIRAA